MIEKSARIRYPWPLCYLSSDFDAPTCLVSPLSVPFYLPNLLLYLRTVDNTTIMLRSQTFLSLQTTLPIRSALRSNALPVSRRSFASKPLRFSRPLHTVALTAALGGAAALAYTNRDDLSYVLKACRRTGQAAFTGLRIAFDYQWMFLTTDGDEAAKSACHTRSAERVLATMESLGGIFIKWGQHLSSMVFILPEEYTSTLARCQDRCTSKTTLDDIRQLVIQDCSQDLDSLFSEFDPEPIGVASLAQVHRARLRETGQVVAVKLQHPQVEAFCQLDIDTVSWIFDAIQWWFPDFGFHWVSEDMRDSLPQELDFRNEANHARRLTTQFACDTQTALVVPQVMFAHKRILCMECKWPNPSNDSFLCFYLSIY